MGFYLLNGYTINAWFPRVAKDGILLGALIFLDIWKKQYENQSQIANITLKIKKKILTIPNASEDMKPLDPSCSAGESVKWGNHFRKLER